MAVPQLADVKEEHNRMEKSVHDVTFVLERRTELLNDYMRLHGSICLLGRHTL